MTVGLKIAELATALRITTAGPPPEPTLAILQRLLDAATLKVESYAPDAPAVVQDQAVIIMAGYLYDAAPVMRRPALAFTNSGAESLLSSWRDHTGVAV